MNVYVEHGQSSNYQYGRLTIVEGSPCGGHYFDVTKDRLFSYLVKAGIVQNDVLQEEDPAWHVHQRYQVNFVQYCDDDELASVDDLCGQELQICRQQMDNYLLTTQSDVVVFVGAALARKHFRIKAVQMGVLKEKGWENSGLTSCFFLVPNTRKVNRTDSGQEIERWFTELNKLLNERQLFLVGF